MKKRHIYTIAAIAIFIFIILILMLSPLFNIKDIEINGLKRLEKNEIIREVGLDKQDNLLAFNTVKAKASLKNNYYIQSIKISKKLPNKIIFNIKEREIAGYIPYINDYLYIDKNGLVVDIKPNYTESLPLIVGLKFDRFVLGEKLEIDDKEAFNIVMRFTNAISEKEIASSILKIDLSDLNDIHIYVGNIDVLIGKGDNINIKINTLIEIIKNIDIQEKGFLYLDDINSDPIFRLLT